MLMNKAESDCLAVLTGDLVASTQLSTSDLERVRRQLLEAVEEVADWEPGLVVGGAEFFRGDSWQLLLARPRRALRVALYLRAALTAQGLTDTRLAIGLGAVEAMAPERISMSTGPAFVLSGRGLDELPHRFRMAIRAPSGQGALADWLPVIGYLCDALVRQWTRRQAEIVRHALAPSHPTQAQIADRLDPRVTPQAVGKALTGAEWRGLQAAVEQFEDTRWVLRGAAAGRKNH
jgi:hypothetical protein